jgi:chorismate-pyruvate lyase
MRIGVTVALLAAALSGVDAQQRTASVDAFAQVQQLNATLLSSGSATRTLATWCGDHHLADAPRIVARRAGGADTPPTAEQRRRLGVDEGDVVKYRRVELTCGSRVLSVADNWYVPSRLTAEMNRLLETTDTPFGTAVAPLEPTRQTFLVRMLWTDSSQPAPDTILEHRAVLYAKDHQPFSEVDERYQRALLANFPSR